MDFFRCRSCEQLTQLVASLRSQLSDERTNTYRLQEAFISERKDLMDRIMAITAAPALREARRSLPAGDSPKQNLSGPPIRPHFPGLSPDLRPPVTLERLQALHMANRIVDQLAAGKQKE